MTDVRITKWAEVLVNYSLGVKKNDLMQIKSSYLADPLIKEVYRLALQNGAHPYVTYIGEGLSEIFFKYATEEQLNYLSPIERYEIEKIDKYLFIIAEFNRKSLSNVDPQKLSLRRKATGKLLERRLQRAAKGEMRWSLTAYPDNAQAQDAEMSLEEFSEFIFEAGFLNDKDPIKKWQELAKEQQRISKILSKVDKITIKAEGTDLTLSVKGRKWISCEGHENFPDGEVFTAPIEDSADGVITYSYPCVYQGREVSGVQLRFKKGIVVEAKAEKGEDYLRSMINIDSGAKRIGEFSFGTNYGIKKFIKNILFDEKIGGTIHIALGSCYPETGGKNKSSLHWDMICDLRKDSEVLADGKVIYRNGKFLI
ncbi:MAG: aminopeptidase [candidate division WOR-3 bacterium]|nr:aminopeptidase [candidate division WOR-3 bacterium]MCX7756994.1 aminopeptidase [candidate division WOR-3 bacterium]MDW7987831.1 aminopeptidase [candidate division WOR-3 bacterium]